MEKDIVILFLLLVIVILLAIIAYLMGRDERPTQAAPDTSPPVFPADEILESIRRDFDNVALTWESTDNDPGSRNPRERTIQGQETELPPVQEPTPQPKRKPPEIVFDFKPKRKGRDKRKAASMDR